MAALTESALREAIARSIRDLPAMPEIVNEVLAETRRETCTADRIAMLVGADQAISAKVLKVVNSAYYGFSGQISSITQAVLILGVVQVRNLVLSIAASGMFNARTPTQKAAHVEFWSQSLGAGIAAQSLARMRRETDAFSELCFAGGLLHDIGDIFLQQHFPDAHRECVNWCQSKQKPRIEGDMKFFGADHTAVGAVLARVWQLPPEVEEAILKHEGPTESSSPQTVHYVHYADWLAKKVLEKSAPDPCGATLEALQLNPEETNNLFEGTKVEIANAKSLFGIL
ncbi:MAG TPA: HDOD domain-containing protein [Fimbriimonadaceae bacterium]|nr:HDOD domain-containing protein [Fimbriimonadaceae bacterium]